MAPWSASYRVSVDGHSTKFQTLDDLIILEERPDLRYCRTEDEALGPGDIIHIIDPNNDVNRPRPHQQVMMVFRVRPQGGLTCLPLRHYTNEPEDCHVPEDHWKVALHGHSDAAYSSPGTLEIALSRKLRGELQPDITIDLLDFWHIETRDAFFKVVARVPDAAWTVLQAELRRLLNRTIDDISRTTRSNIPAAATQNPGGSFEPLFETNNPPASQPDRRRTTGQQPGQGDSFEVPRNGLTERHENASAPLRPSELNVRPRRAGTSAANAGRGTSLHSATSNERSSYEHVERVQPEPVVRRRLRRKEPEIYCTIM